MLLRRSMRLGYLRLHHSRSSSPRPLTNPKRTPFWKKSSVLQGEWPLLRAVERESVWRTQSGTSKSWIYRLTNPSRMVEGRERGSRKVILYLLKCSCETVGIPIRCQDRPTQVPETKEISPSNANEKKVEANPIRSTGRLEENKKLVRWRGRSCFCPSQKKKKKECGAHPCSIGPAGKLLSEDTANPSLPISGSVTHRVLCLYLEHRCGADSRT
jgi:hypothetical protein